jgi:hypothetical protein
MDISKIIPHDEFEAIMDANTPSASNVFATMLDLAGVVDTSLATDDQLIDAVGYRNIQLFADAVTDGLAITAADARKLFYVNGLGGVLAHGDPNLNTDTSNIIMGSANPWEFLGATAVSNTVFGDGGVALTSGSRNTSIGAVSLRFNPSDCVAIGYRTHIGNSANGENVAIGNNINSSGDYSVTIGHEAAEFLDTNQSVIVGRWAGKYVGTGVTLATTVSNQLVLLGNDARALAQASTNEIAIGYASRGRGSNTAILGNASIANTYLNGDMHIVKGTFDGIFTHANTVDRTYTLQDGDGTVAFLTDIGASESLSATLTVGNETSGANIFVTGTDYLMFGSDSLTTGHRIYGALATDMFITSPKNINITAGSTASTDKVVIQGGGVSDFSKGYLSVNASDGNSQLGFGSAGAVTGTYFDAQVDAIKLVVRTGGVGLNTLSITPTSFVLQAVANHITVDNDAAKGLIQYSEDPTTTTGWGARSLTDKAYVDASIVPNTTFGSADITFTGARAHDTNGNNLTISTDGVTLADAYLYMSPGGAGGNTVTLYKAGQSVNLTNTSTELWYNDIAEFSISSVGTELAVLSTQKLGIWGATPIVQPAHIVDPTAMVAIVGSAPTAMAGITGAVVGDTIATNGGWGSSTEGGFDSMHVAIDANVVDIAAAKTAIDFNNAAIDLNITDIAALKTATDANKTAIDAILAWQAVTGLTAAS